MTLFGDVYDMLMTAHKPIWPCLGDVYVILKSTLCSECYQNILHSTQTLWTEPRPFSLWRNSMTLYTTPAPTCFCLCCSTESSSSGKSELWVQMQESSDAHSEQLFENKHSFGGNYAKCSLFYMSSYMIVSCSWKPRSELCSICSTERLCVYGVWSDTVYSDLTHTCVPTISERLRFTRQHDSQPNEKL